MPNVHSLLLLSVVHLPSSLADNLRAWQQQSAIRLLVASSSPFYYVSQKKLVLCSHLQFKESLTQALLCQHHHELSCQSVISFVICNILASASYHSLDLCCRELFWLRASGQLPLMASTCRQFTCGRRFRLSFGCQQTRSSGRQANEQRQET